MKRKLLFAILAAFAQLQVNAQFYDNAPCTSGNPNGPNFINWTAQNFTIHTNALGSTNIQSPFYLSSLTNPNVNEFSRNADKDFNSADGWELWKYDFGTPTARNDVPYLVLYNRHTGLLRVFVAFANLLGQNNAISIQLKYKDNTYRSAVLENYNNDNGRNATQNFSNNVKPVLNSNYYLNSVLTWYHSDFYLHFDPCICNYKTSIVLEVKLSNNGNFSFTIEGQAIQNIQGGQTTDANGRWGEKGIFSSFLDLPNQPYKSYSLFRDVFAGATLGKNIVNSKWAALPPDKKNKWLNLFTGLTDGIPIISAFSNFLTTLVNGNSPQKVMPMIFDINLKGQGNITYTYNYSFNELVVPGSEQTLLATEILPYHNDPVGVFTLLHPLTIDYYERVTYQDEWDPEMHETHIERIFQLRNEPIIYTVNPHAGFDLANSTIKASIVYKGGSDDEVAETELYDLGCVKDIRRYFYYYKFQSPTVPPYFYEEGWVPFVAMLKISANFKVAGTNLSVPYVATYNLNEVANQNLAPPYQDIDPSSSCNATFTPANTHAIKDVCNGSVYQNRVTEFARARPSPNTATDSVQLLTEAKVFPNPVNDYLKIALPESFEPQNGKIEIFSSSGAIVYSRQIGNTTGVITINNLSHLSSGLYLVRLVDTKGKIIHSSKIIKE